MRKCSTRWSQVWRKIPYSKSYHYRTFVVPDGLRYRLALTQQQRDHFRSWSHDQLVNVLLAYWQQHEKMAWYLNTVGIDELAKRYHQKERHQLIVEAVCFLLGDTELS